MNIDQKLEVVNRKLDEYETKIGLSSLSKNNDVEKILALPYQSLSSLDDETCGEMAFLMFQYSIYIQKENNRHSAVMSWCKHYLDLEIGSKIDQYSGKTYSHFEEKKIKVLADQTNEYINKLNRLSMQAKIYHEETNFIANRVSQLGSCLLELQQTKRKNKYANSSGQY